MACLRILVCLAVFFSSLQNGVIAFDDHPVGVGSPNNATVSTPVEGHHPHPGSPEQPPEVQKPPAPAVSVFSRRKDPPKDTPPSADDDPYCDGDDEPTPPVKGPGPSPSPPVDKAKPSPGTPVEKPKPSPSPPVEKTKPSPNLPVEKPKPSPKPPVEKTKPSPNLPVEKPKPSPKPPLEKPKPSPKPPVKGPKPSPSPPVGKSPTPNPPEGPPCDEPKPSPPAKAPAPPVEKPKPKPSPPAAKPSPAPVKQKPTPPQVKKPAPSPTPVEPSPPTDSDSETTSQAKIDAYLKSHNKLRAQHGAAPLVWNDKLATAAKKWASNCEMEHSGGKYGENLSASAGKSASIPGLVKGWADEVSAYNPNNPVYSHFTQMVWKATTDLGCYVETCHNSKIFDYSKYGPTHLLVCKYYPAGNAAGQFGKNVQP